MDVQFLFSSFIIGILAASGCGPIFILTFNRSAVCGFWKGFMTAVGASIGDAAYFLLGLFGALAVISEFEYFIFFLDLIGGILLIGLGIHSFRKMKQVVCATVECSNSVFFSVSKGFMLTVLNPLVVLFFMAITLQALPDNVSEFSRALVVVSSFFVFLGSLVVLSGVSLVASCLGSCITTKKLRLMSGGSGIVFILFGLYLFVDFFMKLFHM